MASTRIVRMIWVIVSVWICCMRGQQRRLIPIDDGDGEHDSNLNPNLNHDLDRCGNDDEQCQSGASDRSLLSAGVGLLVFVRNGQTSVPVEVDFLGTVGDLRRAYAETYGVDASSLELHFGGKKMADDGEVLADIGVCMEATVDVIQRNDIDDFLQFIGDSIPAIWPEQQLRDDTLSEIEQRKQQALSAAAGPDTVDFSDVIKYLNSKCDMAFELKSDENGKITRVDIRGFRPVQWQPLKWQHLPEQTRQVMLKGLSNLEQLSLTGIECPNLEHLSIQENPNLSRVDLQGIEKCRKLTGLVILDTGALNLSPLRQLSELQEVKLSWNGLTELDVASLRECPVLSYVHVSGQHVQRFDDAQRAKIEKAFSNAGFRIAQHSRASYTFVRDRSDVLTGPN